jgi:hypothetical protein
MSEKTFRLWYFEAHRTNEIPLFIDREGNPVGKAEALLSALIGTEEDAHREADKRCHAYDLLGQPAIAVSFRPVTTLNESNKSNP